MGGGGGGLERNPNDLSLNRNHARKIVLSLNILKCLVNLLPKSNSSMKRKNYKQTLDAFQGKSLLLFFCKATSTNSLRIIFSIFQEAEQRRREAELQRRREAELQRQKEIEARKNPKHARALYNFSPQSSKYVLLLLCCTAVMNSA